jgi:hypothetical protein
MVRLNKTRVDYLEKFRRMIEIQSRSGERGRILRPTPQIRQELQEEEEGEYLRGFRGGVGDLRSYHSNPI